MVVVGTRDCSLQRRHQKLVEEAPAPFLTDEQTRELYSAAKAILQGGRLRRRRHRASSSSAQDGTISFLEVNTRLQVEHPVTEEVTGIDLVREQFRIADGEELGYDDPTPRGHSFEFRINGEDPGRGFLPAPGTVTAFAAADRARACASTPASRRARVIGGAFDSLLAKLIVTGATREQALERVAPRAGRVRGRGHGHGAAVPPRGGARPGVHRPSRSRSTPAGSRPSSTTRSRRSPDGRREAEDAPSARDASSSRSAASASRSRCPPASARGGRGGGGRARRRPASAAARPGGAAASGDALTAPMQGTIVKVAVEEGQQVAAGDLVVVLEAMKMEQPLNAHKAGTVTALRPTVGERPSPAARCICEIKD